MVGHKYTKEEHSFLCSFVPGHTYQEIIEAYNKRFAEPITRSRLKGYIANHKLNTGKTGRFEKGHVPINKGTHPPTVGRMAETQFKKGHLPHNTKPVGYERVTRDGYVEVKVRMRPSRKNCNDNFVLKHRIVWESHYGPIPKGHIVIFLDGDKRNFDISNLMLVSHNEHLQLTRMSLRCKSADLTKSAILVVRAAIATIKARNHGKRTS